MELYKEIQKILDGEKSKIIKKYNLSLADIETIIDLLNNKYNTFIQKNVYNLLMDYNYNVQTLSIGFILKK